MFLAAKTVIGIASVIAGGISSYYWFRSSKAEVLAGDPRVGDDIIFETDGRSVAVSATGREQSKLNARGAIFAAIAVLLQATITVIDLLNEGS